MKHDFIPKPIGDQRIEYSEGHICLTDTEIKQGNIVIETVTKAISELNSNSIGLCFPGIKNKDGIVVMANGPRIPDFKKRIKEIDAIYNDSDCCVIGECHSTIGKLQDAENCIYIGGGTGVDGIVINGEIIDFNVVHDVKRSWELLTQTGETVESYLSPAGMIERYNRSSGNNISTILELSQQKDFIHVVKRLWRHLVFSSITEFNFLNRIILVFQKIVIGQRLGSYLKNHDHELGKTFKGCTTIPIEFSEDEAYCSLRCSLVKSMLVKGKKPKSEPLISVGLILPIDKQNSITISNDIEKKTYIIEAENDHLLVSNIKPKALNSWDMLMTQATL